MKTQQRKPNGSFTVDTARDLRAQARSIEQEVEEMRRGAEALRKAADVLAPAPGRPRGRKRAKR